MPAIRKRLLTSPCERFIPLTNYGMGCDSRSAIPAISLTHAAFSPPCIAGGLGRCASTRAWATRRSRIKRYKYLLANGTTGLSVAFDLPTQIGLDSDHPLAMGEVGKVGVAIDSIEDMQRLFDGIALTKISTSMTINATASILLALYVAVARRQGAEIRKLSGTVQNDVLKEYIARGTYIYPIAAGDAHHHRHVCVGERKCSRVEHDFHLRLSHA